MNEHKKWLYLNNHLTINIRCLRTICEISSSPPPPPQSTSFSKGRSRKVQNKLNNFIYTNFQKQKFVSLCSLSQFNSISWITTFLLTTPSKRKKRSNCHSSPHGLTSCRSWRRMAMPLVISCLSLRSSGQGYCDARNL